MHVIEQDKEYDYMWDKLAKHPLNRDDEIPHMCENGGETWQYMGTYETDLKISHQFRHRRHPKTSDRQYIYIEASKVFKYRS